MNYSLSLNQQEYDLISNYLRLDVEHIRFDNSHFTEENWDAYNTLNSKLQSLSITESRSIS